MADKNETEEYEDINIDVKDNETDVKDNDNEISDHLIDENIESNDSEMNELEVLSHQLAKDYSNYFTIDTTSQKKETDDAIEDLLTHLEEFCGLIEMIRTDSNICLEHVINQVYHKSILMNDIYEKIDKLEVFVQMVKNCVEDMEKEVTKAEQLFANNNNNKVRKFFSSIIGNNSTKPSVSQRKVKYEPKHIFKTSDYIKSFDELEIGEQNSETNTVIEN